MATSLNLVLVGLRLGLKNRQVGEKWVSDDCSYLCKGLYLIFYLFLCVFAIVILYYLLFVVGTPSSHQPTLIVYLSSL
ncbi:hypothetical protein [bacterium endosymbiont of Bathymodiolus sp. 5 South]|uniref:hypothetical protein n=1 Tax=bacterium endosymbiont of Bathymodiolus sp. 5 South TaxID=1181670 RepID=UPI0011192BA8|nr:hypothetical protein [bacterium endosymbiont of Bathymodiolus sp. 5 South]